jgi:chemotaxis protein MotB
MRRKKGEGEQENHERWLLTYADLITLLLAFFIMMYTLSKQDAQKYQEVTEYLRAIFTGGTAVLNKGGVGSGPAAATSVTLPPVEATNNQIMKQLEEEIKNLCPLGDMEHNFSVFADERGIVVRVLDKAFYDEGKADLKDKAKKAIQKIIPIIKQVNRDVRIEGHTDDVPINTTEFRSNWELSVRRATEVVRYIIEKSDISPKMISAAGYAEFKPLMANNSAENRAMNRRIEIIIEKPNNKTRIEIKNSDQPGDPPAKPL